MDKRALIAILLLSFAMVGSAHAEDEKGLFGIGLIVGEPTGITAKYYLGDDSILGPDWAVDAAVGGTPVDRGYQVHSDLLWHPWILESTDLFVLPAYLGPGLRMLSSDEGRGNGRGFHVGVRGVVGALFDFRRVPLDVFVEVAGILEYRFADIDDGVRPWFNAGAGVRYYF